MRRLVFAVIPLALSSALACGGGSKPADPAASKTAPAEVAEKPQPPAPVDAPDPATPPSPPPEEPAAADDTTTGEAPDPGDGGDPETTGADAAPTAEPGDFRHVSLVPADTPAANRDAFLAMEQRKSDGAPVGGIGPAGIHLDELVLGRDYADGECTDETDSFSLAQSDRVHLCLRVVHGGATQDPLTVTWQRGDAKPRASNLTLKNPHAYLTHAWHPIRKHSDGDWTVTVNAADGTVLGRKSFVVAQ